jgi:hypothetical protein
LALVDPHPFLDLQVDDRSRDPGHQIDLVLSFQGAVGLDV